MSDDQQHIFRAVIETATLLPVLRRDIDLAVTRIQVLESRAAERDRAGWRVIIWFIERFGVPLVAAAAGAVAVQRGWLP